MIDSDKYSRVTIVARRDLAADLWVIRVEPSEPLSFRPGQYLTLGMMMGGRVIERPYSIASAPDEAAIELFIERVPDGELSAPLHDMGVGSELLVRRRCKGLFLKEVPLEGRPHLLVATVTGVAPFVSLLRSMASRHRSSDGQATPTSVLLVQGAAYAHEFAYEEELTALAQEMPWFSYVPTVSRPHENLQWSGEVGRVEDVLRKHADAAGMGAKVAGAFLCGHPGMIHNVRSILRRAGFPDREIREEQYWPE